MDANTNVSDDEKIQTMDDNRPAVHQSGTRPVSGSKKANKAGKNRGMQAKLDAALAEKRCLNCLSVGCWEIYKTDGKVRYVRCKACGKSDKIAV